MLLTNLAILTGVYLSKHLIQSFNRNESNKELVVYDSDHQDNSEKQKNQYYGEISGASIFLVTTANYVYPPLTLLNIGLISYTSVPILQRTFETLRTEGKIDNDGYSALIAVMTLGTGSYFAAATHNTLYHISSYLVKQGKDSSIQLASQAYHPVQESVWIETDSVEKQILISQVQAGDIVIVSTGEAIPLDGIISTGSALVDQQALTGEARPIEKIKGDEVMASTLVLSGRIGILASQGGEDTRIKKLNQILYQTRDFKTQLQLKGESWSNRIALPVIASSALVTPFLGVGPALALLFSAPANTVRSMLSVQTSAYMQRTAQQGILIKDGRVLEELSRIDTLLFDKTGTLTESLPEVADIISCADQDEMTLLALAAAAEQRLQHPVARAIVDYAVKQKLTLPVVEKSLYDLGLGVSVQIAGKKVLIGSQRFIQKTTCVPKLPIALLQAQQAAKGHSFILIAVDGIIQGAFVIQPRLRPEVPQLMADLRHRGFKQLAIVSGDQQAPTEKLGMTLGMDAAYANVLPQDKAALIKQLQAEGRRVCFVGDGVNDAIAMKQANVSVCLNSASSLTCEMAQVVMLDDNLAPLDELFDVSTGLHKGLSRNLYFWVGFGAANMMAVSLLAFRPLQSSLLYGAAYSVGLLQSKRN